MKAATASNLDHFWDGESGLDTPTVKVIDAETFAREVKRQLFDVELEDGSAKIVLALEQAMIDAIEDGCEGIDHEEATK